MFFGSGNLVFPIALGQAHYGFITSASLGILITGVLVPFLGVYGMVLFEGKSDKFFGCLGKKGYLLLCFLCLGLMGPFGVMARCLTVAHGSLTLVIGAYPLALTSFVLCVLIYLFTYKEARILPILGNILTPILIVSLVALGYFGLQAPVKEQASAEFFNLTAFKDGYLLGYQIMDLIAAFFFSKFVLDQVKKAMQTQSQKKSHSFVYQASFVGASLLGTVYVVMVVLGSRYSNLLQGVNPRDMLATLSFAALGPMAAPVVCTSVVLACLTTAIVLAKLFATFVQKDLLPEKISPQQSLILTLLVGFLVSTLDFELIARFLGPILATVYPSMIVLTLMNISHKLYKTPISHWPVTVSLGVKMLFFA